MAAGYDLAINLAAVAIGGASVAGWNRTRRWIRYRKRNAFWSFLQHPTVFVVGELESTILMNTLYEGLETLGSPEADRQALVDGIVRHVRDQEDSGLIGRGDFDAMVNLVILWTSLRLPSKPLILHPSEIGERLGHNLVLIGGPDVNSLTESLSPQLGCELVATRDSQNHNMVKDLRLNKEYRVETAARSANGGQSETLIRDYGVLARGPNPDNPDSVIVIFAGAHGLGTFAATEVCVRKADENRLFTEFRQYKGHFESLIRYERLVGGPSDGRLTIEFAIVRELK